jgi:zinc transport system substrate-binding protein
MKKLTACIGIIVLFLFGCQSSDDKQNDIVQKKQSIVAVNYPLHYFVERIAGDRVDAPYIIPADVDPAYWKPKADDILVYQNAALIIANGADYAEWMDKVSLPSAKILNTSQHFKDRYVETAGATHSHGPEGEHAHLGHAFTIWLNFELAAMQANEILQALSRLLAQHREAFEANFTNLQADLQAIHTQMQTISEKLQGTTLYGSHPVYQYLAAGYGLTIVSEHWEPDEVPDMDQWQTFADEHMKYQGKIMLWESKPLAEVQTKLAEMGITAVVFEPCGNRPEKGDFIAAMKNNLQNLDTRL